MTLVGKLIQFVCWRAARRFDAATNDPVGVQNAMLLDMMRRNAGTDYGRRYGFGSVRSFKDYQRQVPIVSFNDIAADIDRVVAGERNVLTAEDPVMFAQTSGTTGKPKLIPVVPSEAKGPHKDQMRSWIWHASHDHPGLLDGKVVSLVSPAIEGHTERGVPYGSTSGHMYKHQPSIVRRTYCIPYDVFEIADYIAKYYAIMRVGMEHDVRLVGTANPSSIMKLVEKADESSEALIRDIRDGTISDGVLIEPEIRAKLASLFRPNPTRARELEELRRRRDGRLLPADYWPNLRLIGCWKGGTVGHYLDRFPLWFDPDGKKPQPVRDWGYLASEMRGSVPLSDQGSSGVLTIAANLFEFAEMDSVLANPNDTSRWICRTVGEIEPGQEYYIIVSTTSGLYRYDINDVIRVEGRYRGTPEIVFLRKGRGMTNLTGEKVSVNQIIEAHQQAADRADVLVAHFRTEADLANSRYVCRVEFAERVDDAHARSFIAALDRSLMGINIEYEAKRKSQRLGPPVLHVMREGWYERGRQAQVAEGKRAFQAKTEVLTPIKMETQMIRPELERVIEIEAS